METRLRLALFLPILLLFLGQSRTQGTLSMLAILTDMVFALITIIAPLLLLYAFAKSTIKSIRAARLLALPTLLAQSEAVEVVDKMFATVSALLMIIIPFVLLLLFWKGFVKLIKV